MKGKIVLIKDLIGTPPIKIDQRTRNADGSLKYPEQQKEPRFVALERVWIAKEHDSGLPFLYWQWDRRLKETPHCNYSGIQIGSKHVDNYALEVYE